MTHTYFKVRIGRPPASAAEAYYGPFDPADIPIERHQEERLALEERKKNGPLHDPKIGRVIAIGYLNPDGSTDVASAEAGDDNGERSLITEFWRRHSRALGSLAGWGVHAEDLHLLKVRSWALRIQVPHTALRPGSNGRAGWIGVTDVRSEFDGTPVNGKSTAFTMAARIFGMLGERADVETFADLWESADPANRAQAVERLQDDLAQTAAIAIRMGLDHDFPANLDVGTDVREPQTVPDSRAPVTPAEFLGKPTHFDIETGPDVERARQILGEFDPAAVKLGNLKDPDKIRAKIETQRSEYGDILRKLSMLDGRLGRISAIGYKLPDGRVEIPRLPERDMLVNFWQRWETAPGGMGGWNIYGFDLRYILIRSWVLGIRVPPRAMSLAGTGYTKWHRFTDYMVAFTGSRHAYLRLEEAAKFFGIEGKTGKGDEFYLDWESGVPEREAKAHGYLTHDVDMSQGVAAGMGMDGPAPASFSQERESAIAGFDLD